MVTMSIAFILFAGAMFALQIESLQTNARLFLGADISGLAPGLRSAPDGLPEEDMRSFLDRAQSGGIGGKKLIEGYSFMTYGLGAYDYVPDTEVDSLAGTGDIDSSFIAVERNYLDVTYREFAIPTSFAPDTNRDNILYSLYDGAGKVVLPVEEGERTIPPAKTVGYMTLPLVVCGPVTDLQLESVAVQQRNGAVNTKASDVSIYNTLSGCRAECNDTCYEATTSYEEFLEAEVEVAYTQGIDLVFSEGLKEAIGVDIDTPMMMRVRSVLGGSPPHPGGVCRMSHSSRFRVFLPLECLDACC